MQLLALPNLILATAVKLLFDAWEDRAVMHNVGKCHLLCDVVFALESAQIDIIRSFLFESRNTEVVQLAFSNDGVAVYLMHWSLSCTYKSDIQKAYLGRVSLVLR